jgi:hypothetical protein
MPEIPSPPAIDETGTEGTDPQQTPEIVTATQAEAGSINVSVRVLSPGTDGPVTQDSRGTDVVSPSSEPDITAATNPATVTPSVPSQSADVNTNVEVRVLSPGDNGAVSQTSDSAGVTPNDETVAVPPSEAESSSEAEPTSHDSGDQASVTEGDSQRYQGENSQYQSESGTPADPWNWRWVFALDCAGNATPLSTETGSQASLIWTWDWIWNWACISTDAGATSSSGFSRDSSSAADPGNTNVSVRVLSPGDNGPVTQSTTAVGEAAGDPETTGAAPSNGPWSWTWTFTFCGTTTLFSTHTESQTPLSWTWDWAWNWTCDAAVGAPPALGPATQPGADATPVSAPSTPIPVMQAPVSPPTVSAPAADVPPLPPLPAPPVVPSVDVAVVVVVEPEVLAPALPGLSLPPPALAAVDVDLQMVIAPAESPPALAPGTAPTPAAADTASAVYHDAGSSTPTTTTAVAWQPRERPRTRPSSQPTAKRASARAASSRPARSLLPPFGQLRSSQSAGSGTLGARVPGAPVVAVAALIAFFMLVAPSLGRRIRLARELSPRSTYRSSIDHPG